MNAITDPGDSEILALFRHTTQPEADTDELGRLWMRMYEIATSPAWSPPSTLTPTAPTSGPIGSRPRTR